MALGGAVYIVSNHFSELKEDDEPDGSSFRIRKQVINWVNQLPVDQIKARSLSFTQKTLHKARLLLLKSDNHIMNLIRKISESDQALNGNGNGNRKPENNDFWNNLSRDKQESEEVMPALPELPQEEPEPVSELKIGFVDAKNDEAIRNFFDPALSGSKKVDGILTKQVPNKIDIKPAKISSEISEGKPIKKILRKKK